MLFFYESNSLNPRKDTYSVDNDVGEPLEINVQEEIASKPLEFEGPSKEDFEETSQPTLKDELLKDWQFKKVHPQELIISDTIEGVTTHSKLKTFVNLAFISQIEPKNIDDALNDEFWVLAMQEELNQFERNKVWTLVPRPKNHPIISSKWVFRNKMDEQGVITRNKARLVAKRL